MSIVYRDYLIFPETCNNIFTNLKTIVYIIGKGKNIKSLVLWFPPNCQVTEK